MARRQDLYGLQIWSQGVSQWHRSLCDCARPWEHLPEWQESRGGAGGGASDTGDGGPSVEDLLQAAAEVENGGAGDTTKTSEGEKTSTTGTPLR